MTAQQLFAQVLGVILIVICIIIPHFKTKSQIMLWCVISNAIWALQFFFLGATAGLWVGLIAFLRSFVFYLYSLKDKTAPIWVFVAFLIVLIIGTIYSWTAWYCIFLVFGFATSYGQWSKSEKAYRICVVIATIGNGIYLVITGGISGAINEFLQTGSAIAALWRFKKK